MSVYLEKNVRIRIKCCHSNITRTQYFPTTYSGFACTQAKTCFVVQNIMLCVNKKRFYKTLMSKAAMPTQMAYGAKNYVTILTRAVR